MDEPLPDWLGSHVRAGGIGGVPRSFVPDNAQRDVKACLYKPQVNRSYAEMAAYYDRYLPARPRKPRDKAKVERPC